jgi:hypothetical protein
VSAVEASLAGRGVTRRSDLLIRQAMEGLGLHLSR